MPRAQQSEAGSIVEFFRTKPMEVANLVMGLCQDALRTRKQVGEKIKAAQNKAKGNKPGPKPALAAAGQVTDANAAVDAATASATQPKGRGRGGRPRKNKPAAEVVAGEFAGQPVEGELPAGAEGGETSGDQAGLLYEQPEGALVEQI